MHPIQNEPSFLYGAFLVRSVPLRSQQQNVSLSPPAFPSSERIYHIQRSHRPNVSVSAVYQQSNVTKCAIRQTDRLLDDAHFLYSQKSAYPPNLRYKGNTFIFNFQINGAKNHFSCTETHRIYPLAPDGVGEWSPGDRQECTLICTSAYKLKWTHIHLSYSCMWAQLSILHAETPIHVLTYKTIPILPPKTIT